MSKGKRGAGGDRVRANVGVRGIPTFALKGKGGGVGRTFGGEKLEETIEGRKQVHWRRWKTRGKELVKGSQVMSREIMGQARSKNLGGKKLVDQKKGVA